MAVPDFQTLMRPLLEEYAAGSERPIAEVRAVLASKFALSQEELAERLLSGLARTFDNRVGWAATYLYRVGLLARPRRSVYAITERGRDVLKTNPERVDLSVLAQFPEFAEFRKATGARRRRTRTCSSGRSTPTGRATRWSAPTKRGSDEARPGFLRSTRLGCSPGRVPKTHRSFKNCREPLAHGDKTGLVPSDRVRYFACSVEYVPSGRGSPHAAENRSVLNRGLGGVTF